MKIPDTFYHFDTGMFQLQSLRFTFHNLHTWFINDFQSFTLIFFPGIQTLNNKRKGKEFRF